MKTILLILTVLMVSCAPKPFKGNDPGDEMRPFVESFFEAWGQPAREIQYNFIPLEGKTAECVWNDTGLRIINVDPDKWESFCELERKAVIWHELGHCQLGRTHVDLPARSYLNANIPSCAYIMENQETLDQEMFE